MEDHTPPKVTGYLYIDQTIKEFINELPKEKQEQAKDLLCEVYTAGITEGSSVYVTD